MTQGKPDTRHRHRTLRKQTPFRRLSRRFSGRHPLLLLPILLLSLTWANTAAAQEREYALKAAFIFHLTQFIEWPPEGMPEFEEPFRIGVVAPNPFGASLEEVVQGARVGPHLIEVEYLENGLGAEGFQIIFIPRDAGRVGEQLLNALRGRPILLVGEEVAFLKRGGMVSLVRERDRVSVLINTEALHRANLEASSRLLRLARIVDDQPAE